MMCISIFDIAGPFAENKDVARDVRVQTLLPALARGEIVTFDFAGVEGATQSFIHALISETFRIYGEAALDHIRFKDCNAVIQKVITIVTEYMQEAEQDS